MVRAETYASKGAFPRKAASAAPSCMVNVPFHFYCPKELFAATGISQSGHRGCWWLNESLPLLWCPPTLQPNILWAHLPSLPTYFFQLHLSHLILPWRLAWNPSPAVFLWWANSSWGFVRPHCTKLLPTSFGVEPHALYPTLLQRLHLHHLQELSCCPCQSKTLRELAANTEVVSVLSLSCYLWKLHGFLRLSQQLRYC